MNPNFLRAVAIDFVLADCSSDDDRATTLTDAVHWCVLKHGMYLAVNQRGWT